MGNGNKNRSILNVYICPLYSVKMYTNEEDSYLPSERRKYPTPHKHDVISCLGIAGKWVTQQSDLQVKLGCIKRSLFILNSHCVLSVVRSPVCHTLGYDEKKQFLTSLVPSYFTKA